MPIRYLLVILLLSGCATLSKLKSPFKIKAVLEGEIKGHQVGGLVATEQKTGIRNAFLEKVSFANIVSFATRSDTTYLLAQMNCKNQLQKSNIMQYDLQIH